MVALKLIALWLISAFVLTLLIARALGKLREHDEKAWEDWRRMHESREGE